MEKFTPEEKAKLTESRTISDAELILGNKGRNEFPIDSAKFVPSSNGEPRLEVTDKQMENIRNRENPDSQKILLLLNKIKPRNDLSPSTGYSAYRGGVEKFWPLVFRGGFPIRNEHADYSTVHYSGSGFGGGGSHPVESTTVTLEDNEKRPYINIERTHYDTSRGLNGKKDKVENVECYSFQEYYDALLPEEKEKGEALGKELESLLEE